MVVVKTETLIQTRMFSDAELCFVFKPDRMNSEL